MTGRRCLAKRGLSLVELLAVIPFSSTDSDDKWILKVVNVWPEEKSFTGLLKKSVTKPEELR